MKKILLSFAVLAFLACGSQNQTASSEPQKTVEKVTTPVMAAGNITMDGLRSGSNKYWFDRSFSNYHPNPEKVKAFGEAMSRKDYRIDVYMGTWCHDSRREVPHLYKLLSMIDYDMSGLTIVSVNRAKQLPNVTPENAQKLNVHHVPTIIFYDVNGKEVERFVESSKTSLLDDLIKIASGQPYRDSYGG